MFIKSREEQSATVQSKNAVCTLNIHPLNVNVPVIPSTSMVKSCTGVMFDVVDTAISYIEEHWPSVTSVRIIQGKRK